MLKKLKKKRASGREMSQAQWPVPPVPNLSPHVHKSVSDAKLTLGWDGKGVEPLQIEVSYEMLSKYIW